jgi:hypothetical protein
VQALFTLGACSKGRTDPVALVTNKAYSITLIKLLNKVKGLMDRPEKAAPPQTNTAATEATAAEPTVTAAASGTAATAGTHGNAKKKKTKRPNPIIENLCVFLEYDAGRIPLPAVHRKLKPNHIDILFNRAKTETGNLLSYDNFVDCLRLIAAAHYAKVEVAESQTEAGAETAATGVVAGEETQATTATGTFFEPSDVLRPGVDHAQSGLLEHCRCFTSTSEDTVAMSICLHPFCSC